MEVNKPITRSCSQIESISSTCTPSKSKSKSNKRKRKNRQNASRSERAGLNFPVGKVSKTLKQGKYSEKVKQTNKKKKNY
jgi:hypothetical protein